MVSAGRPNLVTPAQLKCCSPSGRAFRLLDEPSGRLGRGDCEPNRVPVDDPLRDVGGCCYGPARTSP